MTQFKSTVNGTTVTANLNWEAGRAVENASGGVYTQVLYGPGGSKLALMSGQTLSKGFVALPGGGEAVYTSAGLAYYRHNDWLGTSRLASAPSRTVYSDTQYAPYGEPYNETGTRDRSFTGKDEDTVAGNYDFPARRYNPTQGRFISPDPSGLRAMDLSDPQSINRYAYVKGQPCNAVDPMGLFSLRAIFQYIGSLFTQDDGGTGGGPIVFYAFSLPTNLWPGGGSAGGPRTAAQTKWAREMLYSVWGALGRDQKCNDALSRPKLDVQELAKAIYDNESSGVAVVTSANMGGGPSAAAEVGNKQGGAITINSTGAFFSGSYGGQPMGVNLVFDQSRKLPATDINAYNFLNQGGTLQAQAFILLHELAHLTGAGQPDLGDVPAEAANDKLIRDNCQGVLSEFDQKKP